MYSALRRGKHADFAEVFTPFRLLAPFGNLNYINVFMIIIQKVSPSIKIYYISVDLLAAAQTAGKVYTLIPIRCF